MLLLRHASAHAAPACLSVLLLVTPAFGAELFTGELMVQSQAPGSLSYRITEYQADGSSLQTITPEQAPGSTNLWNPRDLVIGQDGLLYLYNGTFDPYLSILDPMPDDWSHITHDGWSTINNVSYGGIARAGDRVFVTNMSTAGQPSSGVVVFDTAMGTSTEFASSLQPTDLNLGLDGKLWVLNGSTAFAYDPASFASMGSVSIAAAGSDIRSLAVDADGNFYVATWGGNLARLAPDGSFMDSLSFGGSLTDVDVSPAGLLAVGTRLDGAWLTDTSLSDPVQIESNRWNSFVTFVPEPATLSALLILGALIARGSRRNANR